MEYVWVLGRSQQLPMWAPAAEPPSSESGGIGGASWDLSGVSYPTIGTQKLAKTLRTVTFSAENRCDSTFGALPTSVKSPALEGIISGFKRFRWCIGLG